MKKIVVIITAVILSSTLQSQTLVADFENFTLTPNSFYHDTNSTPFITPHAKFTYQWTKGNYPYWSGGFSYTNKYDSATAGFMNMYGVRAYKGNNNSSVYTVAKDKGIIRLSVPQTTVNGFYYTNTTYAFKSVKQGDSFSRKFGDTTGTGSGTTIAQGSYPDYFKVTVKGFKNGVLKTDSVEIYLADYRFANNSQDFVVADWRYVNTASLGEVDSLKFFMHSSDFDSFGMLTPGFFAIDDFSSTIPVQTGIKNISKDLLTVYPNPCSSYLRIDHAELSGGAAVKISDCSGRTVHEQFLHSGDESIDLRSLADGVYLLELVNQAGHFNSRIIKVH